MIFGHTFRMSEGTGHAVVTDDEMLAFGLGEEVFVAFEAVVGEVVCDEYGGVVRQT